MVIISYVLKKSRKG